MMRNFAQKPKANQSAPTAPVSMVTRNHGAQFGHPKSILDVQRSIGNQAVVRLIRENAEDGSLHKADTVRSLSGHDFSQTAVHPPVFQSSIPRVMSTDLLASGPTMNQRDSADVSDRPEALSTVHDVLRSPGESLDASARTYLEKGFGRDFRSVRVHTNEKAAESVRAVNADAYTVGTDIAFDTGRYAPRTREGLLLIAHELAHVVQQGGQPVSDGEGLSMTEPFDFHEQEASRASATALIGGTVRLSAGSENFVARQLKRSSISETTASTPLAWSLEGRIDQSVSDRLRDLQMQIDSQTGLLNNVKVQLRSLAPTSPVQQRKDIEANVDRIRLSLIALLEKRSLLVTFEIGPQTVCDARDPLFTIVRPRCDRSTNVLKQRECELQEHRQQIESLRLPWETQDLVEATHQKIEDVNQKIDSLRVCRPGLSQQMPEYENQIRVDELMTQQEALKQEKQTLTESAGRQWVNVGADTRMSYVMHLLVTKYKYSVETAAGLVGNLYAESGVLPQRLEGSKVNSPMTVATWEKNSSERTVSPQEVRDRKYRSKGPRHPGVGLAQWTTPDRRKGLFEHTFGGRQLGTDVLFNMDAQVDYLVNELKSDFKKLDGTLRNLATSVDGASDEVLYDFERPLSINDRTVRKGSKKDPRLKSDHPSVVDQFKKRREFARKAFTLYNNTKGSFPQ